MVVLFGSAFDRVSAFVVSLFVDDAFAFPRSWPPLFLLDAAYMLFCSLLLWLAKYLMLAKDDDMDADTSPSSDDCVSFLLGVRVQLARFVAVKVRGQEIQRKGNKKRQAATKVEECSAYFGSCVCEKEEGIADKVYQ